MTAWSSIQQFAKTNPRAASILFGAIACFASVAVILGFGIDLQSSVPNVMYVLIVGVLLVVLVRIIDDAILMRVLAWFVAIMGMAWVGVFVLDRADMGSTRLACLANPLDPCLKTADGRAETTAPPLPPLKDVPAVPAPAARAIDPGKYAVTFQFAGLVRDRVRSVMEQLAKDGWQVEGVSGGGQRTGDAARTAEVRYGPAADAEAAKALAALVQASNLTGKPMRAVQVNGVPANSLEVWVSL